MVFLVTEYALDFDILEYLEYLIWYPVEEVCFFQLILNPHFKEVNPVIDVLASFDIEEVFLAPHLLQVLVKTPVDL